MDNYEIINLERTESTNLYAIKNIADFKDKTVISVNKQTGGYGRFKRKWHSESDENLYISIILKPTEKINSNLPVSNITQYLSVILCDTIEKYGIKADIKWPNDVLVNKKKIAGILSEASIHGDTLKGIVVGVGINLNMKKQDILMIDQPATSLNIECKKNIDKIQFRDILLKAFFKEYDSFITKGFEYIKSRYISRCSFLGKDILVKNLDKHQKGTALEINNDGSLLLEDDKHKYTVIIGDIIC